MGNLLKWEMSRTFTSKSFWIIGGALVILPSLLLLLGIFFGARYTGYGAFQEGLGNYNAFIIFLIGIFAGIHVTGAFEGRKIQSAVMAGNSRFSILMSKFLSYTTAVTIFSMLSIGMLMAVSFKMIGTDGFDGSIVRDVMAKAAVYVVVEIAYSASCFLTSMLVRHLGGSIGLNLGVMLGLNLIAQIFLNFDWAVDYVRMAPAGQAMILVGDASNSNLAMALMSSVVVIAAVIAFSYIKFDREELK